LTDLSYEILCSNCRAAIPSTSEECPACGHSLRRPDVPALLLDAPAAPSVILDLSFVMVGLTAQKRGLHDYIAGTVVLRG
jgi:hypothetical protein